MGKLKRQIRRMWWDIKDVAFFGTNITRKNGMFMSVSNSIPVGSIYDLKKNFFGAITDENLIYSQDTLAKKYSDYPSIYTDSASSPAVFTLDSSNETSIDILSSMVDTSNIGSISAELNLLLKNAKEISVKIDNWGIDYIQEGEVAVFLGKYKDAHMNQVLDGDNYVATRGIWIKGFQISYGLDQESITKIKSIVESNKAELIKAKLDIDIKSNLELDFGIEFTEKFYPFFKFRRIYKENKDDYFYLADSTAPETDIFLDDVNFTEYSV